MKKFGFAHRALAMLLVIVMTLQLLPLSVLAWNFGELRATDAGVKIDSIGKEDAINWPIKIYDYLNDGILFELNDTNVGGTDTGTKDGKIPVGHATGSYVPYANGTKAPATDLGSDFTYSASSNYTASTTAGNSPYTYASKGTGYAYTLAKADAVDYKSPYHLHITDGSNSGNHNMLLNYFSSDQSNKGNIRYMVMVYRAEKVQNYYFSISLTGDTGGNPWSRNQTTLEDSKDWRYKIIDLYELCANTSYTTIQYIWLTWHTTTGFNSSYKGMNSGAYVDLTHVAYFADRKAAENYGKAAVAFDNDPGEYLAHASSSFQNSYTTVTGATKPAALDKIFTLNYRWKVKDSDPKIFDSGNSLNANVWHGMDFTTHSTANGWKTNAYTSDTFWTWSNGTTEKLKNTTNGITQTDSFVMSRIGVDQMTQSNGAQFVRLTTTGPSKILLSKFREDHQQVQEGYVPETKLVDYMVLVYRANGLSSDYKYGLWAHGYWDASSPDSHKTANEWHYAGLTKNTNWMEEGNINKLSFSNTSGWQYVVIELRNTIGAKDSNMERIDRIANVGMYLPTLADGKSLDIAYVSYFKNFEGNDQRALAEEFGAAAVTYMNTPATSTTTSAGTKSYGNGRVWYGGGNKSFGMLFCSGGGKYWKNGGGASSCTDQYNYGYKYDTWYIGYNTSKYSGDAINTNRKDPVTGQQYTAKYTGTDNTTFVPNASGTTNNIYFFSTTASSPRDTSNIVFDGYQILEQISGGVMTAGLLEGSLRTVKIDGKTYRVPVYRQETVEYIAYNLLHTLRIPQRDSSGNYIYQFIKGSESTQYGGVDLNGDGQIGWINYDGDPRNGNELNEASVDLATALRHELGMTFRLNNSVALIDGKAEYDVLKAKMGTYSETLAKSQMLYGEFSDCRNAIDTAMDAAYYLLNNIFISNSYNQEQDDYDYLTLSFATVNDGDGDTSNDKQAYIFDGGFTTGKTATSGSTFTDDGTNKNAISYDPYTASGSGAGTISLKGVTGKTQFYFGKSGGTSTSYWTNRFPFNPVTDAEGDYAGQTDTYYFMDDAVRVYTEGSNTYKDRNYNYVIASNGEFVYREEDDLFFQFEGDDDVYLFINGELVLDIGACHSITSAKIEINKYVAAAAEALTPLAIYGYEKDMSISEFEAYISGAKLTKYKTDDSGNLQYDAKGKLIVDSEVDNPYTAEQIAQFMRQHRLNLSDNQICQFDFYYMERHGWGANMRILSNMHITDPNLTVDKTAYQFGQELEYGGVVDVTSSVEYNFTLHNTGNTKLYNLNWRDDVLGLTMDPEKGLVVKSDLNGIYVLDATGGKLEAKDLTAIVTGYDGEGNYVEVPAITFPEEDGDGGQRALRAFLESLEAIGTETGLDDAEITHAGSGLWVGASVTFKGIYYMLTPEQTKAGMVDNTVYLTASTRRYTSNPGYRTLRSDNSHRIYTSGFPVHYQWAGHNIFMNLDHLLVEAKKEAEILGTQLSLYQQFFTSVNSISEIKTEICDKYGRVGIQHPYQEKFTDGAGKTGYLINYDEPGVYIFYMLLYRSSYKDGINASEIKEGDYAILRSQVYVADVEDSVYVLDYGLSTESLDVNGELFKNDQLFGPYSTVQSKLMGVSGTQPTYRDPVALKNAGYKGRDYARIDINAQDLETDNRVFTPEGIFKVNLAIPQGGKNIAYNALTGEYTLTGVGTVKINAVIDGKDFGEQAYLYYWYDDGTAGPSWPGTLMTSHGGGQFEIDIPADVPNIIINNGSSALKTGDLKITPGLNATVNISMKSGTDGGYYLEATDMVYDLQDVTLHAQKPEGWNDLYVHYWYDDGTTGNDWPGEKLTAENGEYTFKLPGNASYIILNDGGSSVTVDGITTTTFNQTPDLDIYAGKELWVDLKDTTETVTNTDEAGNVSVTNKIKGVVRYTDSEGYVVRATVPESWGDTIYLYYWDAGESDSRVAWPGIPMTKGDFGWYTASEQIPADISMLIVNDGSGDYNKHQTVDLEVTPGLETWIMVNNAANSEGKYTAKVAYGSETGSTGLTFTPNNFMNNHDEPVNNLWLAITVHSSSAKPSALASGVASDNSTQQINIHNEVQMYKKITILPANVVYYEDDFDGITYNTDAGNSFEYYGNGSGLLSQSVDQNMIYGQDEAYRDSSNNIYSGDSLTSVRISNKEAVASFIFSGTGFEIVGRTNAKDSGTIVAKLYDGKAYAKYAKYLEDLEKYHADELAQPPAVVSKPAVIKNLPMITQFDHNGDGGNEGIKQVPVIRIEDLELDTYGVEISGLPTYEFCRSAVNKKITTAPTCLTGGTAAHTCTNKICRTSWTSTVPATGHSYKGGVCVNCNTQEVKVCEHATTAVVTQPTCVNAGYTTYTCATCGVYVADVVPATGHTYQGAECKVCHENNVPTTHYAPVGTQEAYLYIDGIRVFQPLGATNEHYIDAENGTTFNELRDLIIQGKVAVATMTNGYMNVSSATTTWSENLAGGDFVYGEINSFISTQVSSVDDYLIKGPNNEVYMDGTVSNGALAFYVKETAGTSHDLQIAVRALDYADFYGAGSTKLNVQLQLGVAVNGALEWKNLARVTSGTEQYYTIPYTECPYTNGAYQIVIRATKGEIDIPVMVSYSTVKLQNLEIQTVESISETTILYYLNGLLVEPTYYMTGTINGNTFDGTTSEEELKEYKFKDGELCMTFTEESQISIRRDMGGQTIMYMGSAALGSDKTVTLSKDGSYKLTMPAGDVTFKVVQKKNDSLTLSYCIHNWDDGEITRQPNCTQPGIRTVTCNACGHKKNLEVPTNDKHTFSGGICSLCGTEEPKYYLVGTINGAEYTDDEYLFVDGKLVLTFTNTTSVYLKGENGNTYFAAEDITDQIGDFFTGIDGYAGKMILPTYTEITFTLAVSEEGVLSLRYTVPCMHSWDSGTVVVPPTCLEDGEIRYTCSICNETRTEVVASSGHSYNNGICGICGDKQEDYFRTIYFFDSGNWDAPYIYTWSDSNGNLTGAWPGSLMEPVNGVEGLFRYDVPKSATGVKFHNNGSADSGDQTIPADKNMFTYTGSAWSTYGEDLQYALFGHINGSNYADWSDVGEYIFVDGTLKVTFDKDSYVAVKTTNNAYWYMAQSYIQGDEGVFYKTSTGAGEKMFVPAGAEVTFTLVVNSDDTISLSYIVACTHQWSEGVVTKDATCKEEGIRTFTCGLCGNTKTEKIAVLSHNYVDGTCTSCGQVEADGFRVIYFRNTGNWTEPYFWAWNDNGQNFSGGVWPGMPMEHVEGDLYKVVLEKEATKIIFNGDGAQTADLTLPQDGRDIYTYSTNMWSTYGVTNYYLVGNINGANYGVESDFANLGDYKFVDGKLVVTFTADSYVLVKTDDNVNWFMTDGWMGNETEGVEVVLYNSNDIETDDKLFVPGNVELTFTLTVNEDGTLTLVYEKAHVHDYGEGVVTQASTCLVPGIKTVTCSCDDSYTEKLPLADHSFGDATNCSVCGTLNSEVYRVVYFRNNIGWGNVNVHAWVNGGEAVTGNWPGTAMTLVEDDIYSLTIPKTANMIIFNDGSGNQTADLALPQDGRDLFAYYSNGSHGWYNKEAGAPQYYLVGYINGANHGCEEDYTSMGDFGILNGSATLTFAGDSHVFVKTLYNGKWLLSENYDTDRTATFYENKGEKLFVPAGTWAFTLTENDDGSVTVSYTEAAAPAMLLLEEQTQVSQAAVNAVVASEEEAEPVATPTGFTMNLDMLMNQLVSDKIYGAIDDGEVDDDFPGIEEEPEVKDPTVKLVGAGLAFKDEIFYNIYFNVNNPENVGIVEMGLATWTTKFDGTVENAEYVLNNVVWEGESFKVRSQPIAAKNMGEELYLKVYLKLADGSYIYSDLVSYSAELYAQTLLERDTTSDSMKDLCVALMNYGAAAQLYFGYKTDDLMNANLSAEQKAMISEYSEDMLEDVVMAGDKANGLAANGAVTSKSASVNFGGAFGINYNFVTTHTPDGVMKLYVWTKADFEKADSLTLENASQMIVMTNCGPNAYTARVSGIAAKNVEDTVYVCGIYEADGVTYSTGVLPYSVGNYCERLAAQEGKFQDLAKATCVYAYYARIHLLGA